MAATFNESQKIDYLWKKVGYGVAKTAGTTGAGSKEAFNESISSPLLYRGDLIWMQSDQITSSPPGSTDSIIEVYKDGGGGGYSPTVECTEDLTSPDNQTWNTNLSNWIPTQFGDNYLVQVYVANSGISNPQSVGTKLFQSGSGTDDTWFFDYQAGVLNFNGAVIPSQIVSPITGKSIYIVGYRYVGLIGVTNSSTNITVQDEGSNIVATTTINFTGSGVTVSDVSGVATVEITGGSGGSSNIANGTSNVSIATSGGNITTSVAGNANIMIATGTGVNVAGTLTATGNITGGNLKTTKLISGGNLTITGFANVGTNANIGTTLSVVGNANVGNLGTAGLIVATGNITGGNLITAGLIVATGNITGENLITAGFANIASNANIGTTLSVIGNANVGNLGTAGRIVATGNITGGNLITAGFANVGTTLSVIGNASANNLSVGTFVNSNLIPGADITYDLGNTINRWRDLYLASSTIYLGADSSISAGTLTNGTSNLIITIDGDVSTSVGGNANIIVATSTGVNVAGTLHATGHITGGNLITAGFANIASNANIGTTLSVIGNANVGNLGTAGRIIATGNANVGNLGTSTAIITTGNITTINSGLLQNGNSNIAITSNGNISITAAGGAVELVVTSTGANITGTANISGNANVGNLGTSGLITATGNITGGNANLGNLVTANYLSATGGSIAIGDGSIALAAGNAGIFTVGVYNINFGLNSNITMGSTSGNVTARGNLSTNTISANSIQSKRIAIAVSINTVIDSFPKVDYRSVKYCIRIGSDSGYQAIEVLLVHNGLNSIMTVYGSLSTTGSDLLVLSTSINGANVELIGSPAAGETNTTVNLVAIYIQD